MLIDKFKKQEIEKHYSCRVYGIPKNDKYILTAYLFKDTKKSFVYISDTPKKGYQKIITSYTVISKNKDNNTCVLDVELHTRKDTSNSCTFGSHWASYYRGPENMG